MDDFPTTGKANESLGDLPSRGESLEDVGLDDHEFDVDVEVGASTRSSRHGMLAASATQAPPPNCLAQVALDHPRMYDAVMGLAGVIPPIVGGLTAAELAKQSAGPEEGPSEVRSAGVAGALVGLLIGLVLMTVLGACRPRPPAEHSTDRR